MTDPKSGRAYLVAAEARLTSAQRDLDRAWNRLDDEGRADASAKAHQLADDLSDVLRGVRALLRTVRW